MRLHHATIATAALLIVALTGCAKKTETAQTTSDSLLTTNPVEQPSGNLTPTTQPAEPAPAAQEPAPAPVRHRPASRPPAREPATTPVSQGRTAHVPAGTAMNITFNSDITTETANTGDTWTGTVKDAVVIDGVTIIPAGSAVSGTVKEAIPAKKGDRASLTIGVTAVSVGNHQYDVSASTEPIVAGSTRARNLGAIAGGAVAGALIGRAVGGSGKGALIGGLLGGAAAGGATAASKGYQVHLKPGTDLTFTTNESVAVRMD